MTLNRKQCEVMKMLRIYLNQLGIDAVPEIIWTRKEAIALRRKGAVKGKYGKNWLGWCVNSSNLICIYYSKHKTLHQLLNTLRHELIHYRFPELDHGTDLDGAKYQEFNLVVKELRDGKNWPKFDRNEFVKTWNNKKDQEIMEWKFREFIYWTQVHDAEAAAKAEVERLVSWNFRCYLYWTWRAQQLSVLPRIVARQKQKDLGLRKRI